MFWTKCITEMDLLDFLGVRGELYVLLKDQHTSSVSSPKHHNYLFVHLLIVSASCGYILNGLYKGTSIYGRAGDVDEKMLD